MKRKFIILSLWVSFSRKPKGENNFSKQNIPCFSAPSFKMKLYTVQPYQTIYHCCQRCRKWEVIPKKLDQVPYSQGSPIPTKSFSGSSLLKEDVSPEVQVTSPWNSHYSLTFLPFPKVTLSPTATQKPLPSLSSINEGSTISTVLQGSHSPQKKLFHMTLSNLGKLSFPLIHFMYI